MKEKRKPYSNTKLYYIYHNIKTRCYNKKANNHYITYKGKSKTLAQWSEELNINRQTLRDRIYRDGWAIDKAFTTPVKQNKRYITFEGKTLTIAEWCKELDVNRSVISDRLLRGWNFEDIVAFIKNRS